MQCLCPRCAVDLKTDRSCLQDRLHRLYMPRYAPSAGVLGFPPASTDKQVTRGSRPVLIPYYRLNFV